MGFSSPKPAQVDPAIAAKQAQAAAQAKGQKISLLQDQLGNEDQLRARLYGTRGNPLFGARSQMQGASPISSLFGGGGGLF